MLHPPIHSISLPSRLIFSLFSPSFFISCSVCSAHPAVVLATGIVWSCARAGRAVTRCQSPSAPNMADPPPGCAVTCSAALPLSGWLVPGERWESLLVYGWIQLQLNPIASIYTLLLFSKSESSHNCRSAVCFWKPPSAGPCSPTTQSDISMLVLFQSIIINVDQGPSLQLTNHVFLQWLSSATRRKVPENCAHGRHYPFKHMFNVVKGQILTRLIVILSLTKYLSSLTLTKQWQETVKTRKIIYQLFAKKCILCSNKDLITGFLIKSPILGPLNHNDLLQTWFQSLIL